MFNPIKLGVSQDVCVSTGTQRDGVTFETRVTLLVEQCDITASNYTISMSEYTQGTGENSHESCTNSYGFISVPKTLVKERGVTAVASMGNRELKAHACELGIKPRMSLSLKKLAQKYLGGQS